MLARPGDTDRFRAAEVCVVTQSPERLGCHEPQFHALSAVWPCLVPGSSVLMGLQIGEPGRVPGQAADDDSGCLELLTVVALFG